MNFEKLFISENTPYKGKSQRDNYLSRMFGIFNEEIIRVWCRNKNSPFTDLGRPTIYDSNGRYYTLDFLLKDHSGSIFVSEMKCEIAYQKYRYLTLNDKSQVERHKRKRAFELFLELAESPEKYTVRCRKSGVKVNGCALIWGRTNDIEVADIKSNYSLAHILSTERIVGDLNAWSDVEYKELVERYKKWSDELFQGMLSITAP